MASSAAVWVVPERVAFVNPDAAQARSRRRSKLAALRARVSSATDPENVGASIDGGDPVATTPAEKKEVRRHQRILRNRQSAALSRKRKSDRIEELEIQVRAFAEENRQLRQRVGRYERGVIESDGAVDSGSPAPTAPRRPRRLSLDDAATVSPTPVSTINFATPWSDFSDSATDPATPSTAPFAAACPNTISRPAAETTTMAMQQQEQEQQRYQQQPAEWTTATPARIHLPDEETPHETPISWIPPTPSPTIVEKAWVDRVEGTGSSFETDVGTDFDSGSSCSDSDPTGDAIDHFFVELMAEDAPGGQSEEGAAAAAAAVAEGREGDHEGLLLLSLDGVDCFE